VLALLDQGFPSLQLLLPQVAANQSSAVDVQVTGNVLAGHTGPVAFPIHKLMVVNKGALAHPSSVK